jgi:hypothetical protein
MLLERVYGPRFSLPKSADVVNDGSVHAPLPVAGGVGLGGVLGGGGVGFVGEGEGDALGGEADGDDGDGDGDDADGDGNAERLAGDVARFVGAAVFLLFVTACLGM